MSRDSVIAEILKPIEEKPVFRVGQPVRVLSRIDVNMPKELDYWLGSVCQVMQLIPRGLIRKEWAYELKHKNGHTCEFKEDELDGRYRQRGLYGGE